MADHATREEIDKLRSEIQYLRKHSNSIAPPDSQRMLLESMDRLHGVLEKLVTMFETANKEIYDEYDKGMHDEMAKLDRLLEQNEKLARGIVALADMVKQQQAQPKPAAPAPVAPVSGIPVVPKVAFPPEDSSFLRQPVASGTQPPVVPAPSLPPLAPPSLPPLPPPPPAPSRRSILDKFSFK